MQVFTKPALTADILAEKETRVVLGSRRCTLKSASSFSEEDRSTNTAGVVEAFAAGFLVVIYSGHQICNSEAP